MNQAYALMPQTFEDVIELLIPELRKRGIFWDGYCVQQGTYRENLFETPGQHEPFPDHPAAKMIWRPGSKSVSFAASDRKDIGGQMKEVVDLKDPLSEEDQLDPTAMQLG